MANGINVVYASYAAPAGHAVIDARLYVPADWAGDRDRRRGAGIPRDLEFATKPQLAGEIIKDLLAEGRCPPWVTGDEVYGRDAKLRSFLEDQHTGYVLKIPCSFRITHSEVPLGWVRRASLAAPIRPHIVSSAPADDPARPDPAVGGGGRWPQLAPMPPEPAATGAVVTWVSDPSWPTR